jgi:hypothetical protein
MLTSKEKQRWFVSHCDTLSKRELFVKQLQNYIPVDIFGGSGPLKCPRRSSGEDPCLKMLNTTYKFYLSFENSLCNDYITEKLWVMMKLDAIPIVLGGADYAAILPKHSYIDITHFFQCRTTRNISKTHG